MDDLQGKKILLGLTGGIACYKSAELIRLLVKEGAKVHVVMTEDATRFITPLTMQALSGNPVTISTWSDQFDNNMAHIDLGRACDAIVVAPASANFISQLASGSAKTLLSLLCLARPIAKTPLLIAPAMNREMWQHPATQRNVQQITVDGAVALDVGYGEQACREIGEGRMLEPHDLLQEIIAVFQPKLLKNKKVLVSAGPTYEAIDPVRGITNLSSGKMGFCIAQAAREAGAEVTLVTGPVTQTTPYKVQRIDVVSASQMLAACTEAAELSELFFSVAAVADWCINNPSDVKIKKMANKINAIPTLDFVENTDILSTISHSKRAQSGQLFCVGFAAESHDIVRNATEKRQRKNVPMLVANNGPKTFGRNEATLVVITEAEIIELPSASKLELARLLIKLASVARNRPSIV
jgi:phosphopantothenoylcysteine decarboxylase/phosphopantothenate--cysteine ligase